jgi:hypothetical protein
MKALRQLGFFKIPFSKDEPPEADGRVLELFRNRAELRRAYGELEEETYRLKDRIKQQEGATQRVQEMLGALEARLGLPESAYPAMTFYQLRRLWQSGRELLEQFVADLSRQQDERERRQHVAEHNRRQFARRKGFDKQLADAQANAAAATGQVAELQSQRERLTRFWHYFKRRALDHRITAARATEAAATEALSEPRAQLQALANEAIPAFPGLSLDARRAINLAVIAYAEVLCARLSATRLVTLAREATARREATDEYGSRSECEVLMAQIDHAYELLRSRANVAGEIRVRTERIKTAARYRNPQDTAPLAESIAFTEGDVLAGTPGASATIPNVLAEDTWDLFRVLLR